MNIFSERAGRVTLVPDVGFPLTVHPQGWPGALSMKSVITHVSISSQSNFQFMHTLRNFVYVYVFGEKIGEIVIGGICFPALCDNERITGLERMWSYYTTYRMSQRGAPIIVSVGTKTSFQGWLNGFKVDTQDPSTGLAQFALRLNFFPGEVAVNQDGTTSIELPPDPITTLYNPVRDPGRPVADPTTTLYNPVRDPGRPVVDPGRRVVS